MVTESIPVAQKSPTFCALEPFVVPVRAAARQIARRWRDGSSLTRFAMPQPRREGYVLWRSGSLPGGSVGSACAGTCVHASVGSPHAASARRRRFEDRVMRVPFVNVGWNSAAHIRTARPWPPAPVAGCDLDGD